MGRWHLESSWSISADGSDSVAVDQSSLKFGVII